MAARAGIAGGDPFSSALMQELYEASPLRCPDGRRHEWRQYMRLKEQGDKTGYLYQLAPNGFFCIHCTERRA